ncbi:cell wall metabolism sensor histidine kinase WalK [Motiliproteus sp. MSK22-1]|uniref:sensor histidine kinase n=1 Tax=Motiliproteus sp. MSK22-1 TaxID=1897630 RepID=UPI00097567E5|nr:HAMP domain-containing sensor histidine kinase [Motiliproteus sp. MSK22-1]OMH38915.1 hypothetical protein BGP75_00650 [Motiliproteus sp. MSK22-1]
MLTRFIQSIFTRLLAIFVAAILLMALLFGLGHLIFDSKETDNSYTKHLAEYLDYLIKDIGVPPDLTRAREISNNLAIDIQISSENLQWNTHPDFAAVEQFHYITLDDADIQVSTRRGLKIAKIEKNGYQYTFVTPGFNYQDLRSKRGLYYLIVIIAVLFLIFYSVRRLFRPIKQIRAGAARIGAGELDFRIESKRTDELGQLTHDINRMACDLEQLLEAKRQLLLAISHELRTPLTRCGVAVEMIEDSGLQTSIKEDLDSMNELIGTLIEAERLNTRHVVLHKETLELNDWMTDLIDQNYPKQQSRIWLLPSPNSILISADVARLKLLIKNLIDNALRHSEKQQSIEVRPGQSDSHNLIQIIDQGEGMSDAVLKQVMQPLYRADESRQRNTGGFGLGLYLSLQIAKAHQGNLEIHSELNRGTTVTVLLPRD